MQLILGATLLIGGLAAALLVVVAIPALVGMIAYDMSHSKRAEPMPKDLPLRIAVERGVARAFVIAGGLFWSIAIFAGMYSFRGSGFVPALLGTFFPLVAVLATLAIGWYYERAASALLAIASVAVVAWGVIYGFEMGVWALMTLFLIGPMMTASVLFWLARREQEAFEFSLASRAELQPATVAHAD